MIGKDKVFNALNRTLKKSPAEQTEAVFWGKYSGLTRFANSIIHQNVYESTAQIFFRAAVGRKIGVTSTNSMVEEDLNRALLNAYKIALDQKENPDFDGFPAKAEYKDLKTFYPETAGFTPADRAEKVRDIFGTTKKHDLIASGIFNTSESEIAVLNSNGVEAYQPATSAVVNMVISGGDSSGYSSGLSRDVNNIDLARLIDIAVRKCLDSAKPVELPPAKYDVILEPAAVSELIEWMNYTGLNSKSFDNGTSFLNGREGRKIMGDNITIYDDALDPAGQAFPFDFEGVPRRRVYFVKNGIGGGVVHNSISAKKNNTVSTGHAVTPDETKGGFSLNTMMAGGNDKKEDMIAGVEKGLLVTRFHYVNGMLDTRNLVMTGMTRDGTFLIENGKIAGGIKNLRFTENIMEAFSRVKMISREQEIVDAWWSDISCVMAPTMLIPGFNFTGKTEF